MMVEVKTNRIVIELSPNDKDDLIISIFAKKKVAYQYITVRGAEQAKQNGALDPMEKYDTAQSEDQVYPALSQEEYDQIKALFKVIASHTDSCDV